VALTQQNYAKAAEYAVEAIKLTEAEGENLWNPQI
jgi:hypothetical protein